MTKARKADKLSSGIPRRLRVQLEGASHVHLQSCLLPITGVFVETKLRGQGSKHEPNRTPKRPIVAATLVWEHQVYEYNLTEAEMYSRVLEFAVHQVNCLGQEEVLGSATLPLAEFESKRLSGVMKKDLKLTKANVDMDLHVAVEIWNRYDVAQVVERTCTEFERFVPFEGWSRSHLRPKDSRLPYRAESRVGHTWSEVLEQLPDTHVDTLGCSPGPWFFASSFAGPWHSSNAGWRCRRRVLTQVCRRSALDTTVEVDKPQDDGEALKNMVKMVDLNIEQILQKHDVNLADY